MKINNVLIVYYVHNYHSLEIVKKTMEKHNIRYNCVSRSRATRKLVQNKDLIITVGGDGTFLRTSHLVKDTPMLSVSSDVQKNEGFFAQTDKTDFKKKFHRILRGKYKIQHLPRLAAVINKKTHLPLAVNEFFIGSKRPYHTSLYTLQIGRKKEFQKSSGILIYTAHGSHAWAASAGAKREGLTSAHFHYLVREAYTGRLTKPTLIKGSLKPTQKLTIISSIHDGIATADSSNKEFKFCDKDLIEVTLSKHPLNYVTF